MDIHERKIQAGELQSVQASEQVTRKNVEMVIEFSNITRKMLLEMRDMFDALQNNVISMKHQQEEMRKQLAALQQQFYAAGSTSYADKD